MRVTEKQLSSFLKWACTASAAPPQEEKASKWLALFTVLTLTKW